MRKEGFISYTFLSEPETGGRPKEGPILSEEELQEKFRQLELKMGRHEGELVLMISRSWEARSFDMPEDRTRYGLDENFFLGIIAPPYLKLGGGFAGAGVEIGAKKYTYFSGDRVSKVGFEARKGKGSIQPWSAFKYNLDRMSEKGGKKLLEVIVGDQAVYQWVDQELTDGRIPKFWQEMKRDCPNYYAEVDAEKNLVERFFDIDSYLAFQQMFRALGQEMSLSDETGEIIKRKLEEEKLQLVNSLLGLLEKEDSLSRGIKRVFGIVEAGGGVLSSNEGVTPIEDKGDAIAVTMGQSLELQRTQGEIKAQLLRALKLGLDKGQIVFEKEIRDGYKETLDAPIFVRALCQKYEVTLPKQED